MKNALKNKRIDTMLPPANGTNGVKPRDRVMLSIAYITIALTALLLGLLLWWLALQPDRVFQVKDNKIIPQKQTVAAGEEIQFKTSFCKLIDTPGEITRSFISGETVIYTPPSKDELGRTCADDIIIKVIVPGQSPPGEYRLRYDAKYKINPIKNVHETYSSEPFMVTARQGTGEGQVNQ